MKKKVVLSVIGAALVILGCRQEEPVSPLLTQSEQVAVLAKHIVTPVTFVIDLSDPSNPTNAATCIRVDEKGTLRFRGCEFSGPITGDLVGFEPISVVDLVVDANGNGKARGTFILDVTHATLGSGRFEGRFNGPITAGMAVLPVKARGISGDFVGARMISTSTSPGNNIFTVVGEILGPKP